MSTTLNIEPTLIQPISLTPPPPVPAPVLDRVQEIRGLQQAAEPAQNILQVTQSQLIDNATNLFGTTDKAKAATSAPVAETPEQREAKPTIDGVALSQMVWVRATSGQDIGQADSSRTVSIRSTESTLASLSSWINEDGQDTSKVDANFRNSLHGSLNHHVTSHAYGSWDDKPLVIVAPLAGMIDANGPPTTLNTVDTWWAVGANAGLRVDNSILVAPDTKGVIPSDELSARKGDVLYYPTAFDDKREATLLNGLTERGRERVLDAINERLNDIGREPISPETLGQPRSERTKDVNDAVDASLTQIAKVAATNEAITVYGPVRSGGAWSWNMPASSERDTAAFAAALNAGTERHNGGAEWKSVNMIEDGRASLVTDVPGVSEQTKAFAAILATAPAYQAFAQAKDVDRELGAIAAGETSANWMTEAAAERLAAMMEREKSGKPMPGIIAEDDFGRRGDPITPTAPAFATMVQGAIRAHEDNAPLIERLKTLTNAEPDERPSQAARTDDPRKPETVNKPENQDKPAVVEKDSMRELLDRMERIAPMIANGDPVLARTLQDLSQRGADPDQRAQPGFRHDVAYALQDVEKALGGRLELTPTLRTEMTQLAGSAVELTNERMQALMTATTIIQDRFLVADIREAGKGISRLVDQNSSEAVSKIERLEDRVRLTSRPADPEANVQPPGTKGPDGSNRPPNGPPNGPRDDHDGPGSGLGGPPNGTGFNGNPNRNTLQNGSNNQGTVTIQHSVLDTLLRAMRPEPKQAQPPWEPPATPVADRLAANERFEQMRADDRTLASAEQRGRAALNALQGFTNGEAAAVMSKIQEAAKTEPGGMSQVLSEMRDGGRFADLRKQFGNALSDDAGFAAAYDKAAGALAAYGKSRTEIEPILARRPDATAFTQRLTEMDAEIGKAAAATPSKTEGGSMMEDLAEKARELLQRAVEAVKAIFSRSPSPGASTSSSHSP